MDVDHLAILKLCSNITFCIISLTLLIVCSTINGLDYNKKAFHISGIFSKCAIKQSYCINACILKTTRNGTKIRNSFSKVATQNVSGLR